jgi:hypothetical protein
VEDWVSFSSKFKTLAVKEAERQSYDLKNALVEKIGEKNGVFLFQSTIITISAFKNGTNFFAENRRKSPKIAENRQKLPNMYCDHNLRLWLHQSVYGNAGFVKRWLELGSRVG